MTAATVSAHTLPEAPNHDRVADWLKLIVAPSQVVELRAIGVKRGPGRPHVEGGFFDYEHLVDMAKAALQLTSIAKGVYFTINPLKSELLSRRCNRIDWAQEGEVAKDKDVFRRQWFLIDVDPVRDAMVSATDAEKAEAKEIALAVREFLRSRDWPDPVFADSGNGYHLLHPIDLAADDGGLVKQMLAALAIKFDTPRVHIDQSVHNPSRICKVPSTLAGKGDSTPERPHRRACILEVPGT